MESTCKELLVVAIDFGTTFSGYAFSFKYDYENNPGKISCNTKWTPDTNTYGSLKTPTAILIKLNGIEHIPEYQKFGYEAQDKYTELVENEENTDYFLLDRFKMKLYSDSAVSGLTRDTEIHLGNGYRIKAIDPISKFIEYLKNHFWTEITKRNLDLKESDIRWVLTVPAIWTDGAKQFMKEAAEKAGILSSKLTIAYEPEAAAMCCIHLQDPTRREKNILEAGTKCIVVDAGGGTVDFTVHEVTDSKQLVVKHEPSGGPWGGTTVDEGFMKLLKHLVGEDVYKQLMWKYREDLVTLYREFEYKKRIIKEGQRVILRFPTSIVDLYYEIKGKPLSSEVSGKYSGKIQIMKDKLKIDYDVISELLMKPCTNVVKHTKQLLKKEEGKGTTTLLLVGGFMGSDILQKEMKKHFPKLKHIIPEEPELAVVKGTVLFGHNTNIVKARVARFTYGIRSTRTYDDTIHPEDKKETIDGIVKCKDIFSIHVRKGKTLHVGVQDKIKIYTPKKADQTNGKLPIHVSTEKDPKFVTDSSCSYLGEMRFDIPDTTGGLDRKVSVQMSFGETEITVKVKEEKTGKTFSANFNFLG